MLLGSYLILGICSSSVLVFHETMPVPVFMYSSEIMLRKEERSRTRAAQIDNLRVLLGIMRMDRVPNGLIRIDGVIRWFGHVERIENDRIGKRVYVRECIGSRSVGRPRKK